MVLVGGEINHQVVKSINVCFIVMNKILFIYTGR